MAVRLPSWASITSKSCSAWFIRKSHWFDRTTRQRAKRFAVGVLEIGCFRICQLKVE
jgi:hypothetical protein